MSVRFPHRLSWRWPALACIVLVLLPVLGIAVHAYLRFTTIIPPLLSPDCCALPSATLPESTALELTMSDQVRLACWYVPSHNRAAIIVLHGEGGNRQTLLPHSTLFARYGFGVLSCDRRAHGASMGAQRSWGWLDVNDVAPMLTYLQQRSDVDPRRIGIFGFSIGAQIGLRAAATYPDIQAVVADGPVPAITADLYPPVGLAEWPRFGLDWLDNWIVDRLLEQALGQAGPLSVVQALEQRPAHPLLVIATGQTGHGRELWQGEWFAAVARGPKELWELPDVGHGEGLARYPAAYTEQVIPFYNAALLQPRSMPATK